MKEKRHFMFVIGDTARDKIAEIFVDHFAFYNHIQKLA